MKRFQLCLLAVFMLLVSNCVAGSETDALPNAQTKTKLDTDISAPGKKATLKTDGEPDAKKVTEGQNSDGAASTKQLNPQDDAQKGMPGASGLGTGSSTTKSQSGVKTPESVPGVGGAEKDQTTEGLTPPGAPSTAGAEKEPKAKDEPSKSAPATGSSPTEKKTGELLPQSAPAAEDAKTKTQPGEKPSQEDAPVVSGTTAAPVAEGKPTEGNSGSASTSTHIPTDPAKGADSQASVKAGVLSFILSIGTVLAVFA